MASQDADDVRRVIEDSKRMIAQINEVLERLGAPVRFLTEPAPAECVDDPRRMFPTEDWDVESPGDPNCKHYLLEPLVRFDSAVQHAPKRTGWACKTCGFTVLKASRESS